VAVHDHLTGRDAELPADLVVNTTGPWCERLAAMAGADVPVRPSPGVLLALRGRLCNLVVNRLHPAGDGDIVLPQRALLVVGTSAWVVTDPDDLDVPDEHVQAMNREGARLVPAVATAGFRAAWSAARPLVGAARLSAASGRQLSRTFKCFDHAATDGIEGFVTITGGKATTLRAMAEAAADVVCAKLGIQAPCRTRERCWSPTPPTTPGRGRHERPEGFGEPRGGTPMNQARTVLLRVFRYRNGDGAPCYDEFRVPIGPRMTVLDALLAVRRLQDPSLALRHSCLHASCGTCGMRVNGQEVLACVTPLDGLGDRVVVEPLAGAPVVGDLVVDTEGFYRRLEPSGRPLVRASERAAPELANLQRFEDCIECGLCLSACPVAATDPRYLGPAALAAAGRLLEEPRGADPEAVLGWVDDAHGAWRCPLAFECSEVCPAGVDPAGAIMRLRRRLLRDRLPRPFGRHDREARP